ncbi:MAG TPA: TolC family protein, partial [Cytophagaceae bacterium]
GLVANIANYYYLLLALDEQLRITEETVVNWRKSVETMKELKEAGVVTGAAVVQSEANLYAAEASIPDLKQSIRETENTLSILLARNPGPIERSTLEEQRPVKHLQTGVPSQLLSNRPDVQLAEQGFRQAFELTNVARTMFYPSFTISASAGLSSASLSNFFSANSIFGSLVSGISQPIFNKGANEARLKDAKAQQEEAYLNFRKSLLNAGNEVSNAMYSYETAMNKKKSRTNQITSLEKSVEYTQELLAYGDANYMEVLTAKQNLLVTQINSCNDYLQQLQSIVGVYRSLGGGWQ